MSNLFAGMPEELKRAEKRPEIRKPNPAAVKESVRQRLGRMEAEAIEVAREAAALYGQICEDLREEERIRLEVCTERYGPKSGGLNRIFEEAVDVISASYRAERERALRDLDRVIADRARELSEEKEAGRYKIREEQKSLLVWHWFRIEETSIHILKGLKHMFNKIGTVSPPEAFREGYGQETGLTPPRRIRKQQVMP